MSIKIKKVSRKFFVVCSLFASIFSFSQDGTETIGKTIDDLTYRWDLESIYLEEYTGFKRFCDSEEYRNEIIKLLHDIHHFDSVLYDRLAAAQRFSKDKEIAKTLKDIAKFEAEYDMKSFLQFLNEECVSLRKIDRMKNDLTDELGQESYDGQKYILITEISKYIHHITKRVDLLRKHVHHLHIK